MSRSLAFARPGFVVAAAAVSAMLAAGCGGDGGSRAAEDALGARTTLLGTDEPYSRDFPKQADLKQPIERLFAKRLGNEFGCVAYPQRLGSLVANVATGNGDEARQLIDEQELNDIVKVKEREHDELFSDADRQKLQADLIRTNPAGDVVNINVGPETDHCPPIEISIDFRGPRADVVRAQKWAGEQQRVYGDSRIVIDVGSAAF